jgi:hypothetical protein
MGTARFDAAERRAVPLLSLQAIRLTTPASAGIDTMRIEEKFNLKSAKLIECQSTAAVYSGPGSALGIKVQFFPTDYDDGRKISLHLTPREAMALAKELIGAAINRL